MSDLKKRVLLVSCEGLGNGGVQAIMMGIVRNLSNEFHFDILLFTNETRYYDNEFLKYGGKILRIPHYQGRIYLKKKLDLYIRDNRIYRAVKKLLKNETPYDAIHCCKEFESAPVLKAAFDCGIPVRICHSHVVHTFGNIFINMLNRIRAKQIYKYATYQIGCSDEANNSIYINKSNYKVIPNFYNESIFKYSEDFNTASENHLTISQVGSYSANKNQLFSIKVIEELLRKGISIQLNLIGFNIDQSYRNLLDEYVEVNGLSEYVHFISGDKDFTSILHNSHCLLMPSIHEGFGISLIEAQAIGLQCFASMSIPKETNCGGVQFISLNESSEVWANYIIRWYQSTKGIKVRHDTSKFKSNNVMNQYRILYYNDGLHENNNSR